MIFGNRKKDKHPMPIQAMYTHFENDESVIFQGQEDVKKFFVEVRSQLVKGEQKYTKALNDVNHLSQYMMKMDFVKEMISLLNIQSSSVEMVASTTEEMSTSILGISELVMDNSTAARKSVEVTENGTRQLKEAVGLIKDAFDLTGQAKGKVADVTNQAVKIKDMVSIIESVAEQTNLLALNASIEAARAGEAGRGFSVVADEIRKLAESTTDSVLRIQEVVNSLNGSVSSAVDAIEDATVSFKKGIDHVNDASVSVEASKNEVVSILKGLEMVGSEIEEQTAATEETAATVAEINENTKLLHTQTQRTGKAFSDIAKEVNHLRVEMVDTVEEVAMKDMLDIVITDHLNWRWMIYNMIMGFEKITVKQVGSHHQCQLGKWIETHAKFVPELKQSLNKLHEPHKALHQAALNAVKSYNAGDVPGAEMMLDEIDDLSTGIVSILNEMMGIGLDQAFDAGIFEWSNKLTVYNKKVDDQHKQLLKIGQKMFDFSRKDTKTRQAFLAIVEELKSYTVYHFEEEEALLQRHKYPDLKGHKVIHKKFVDEITKVDYGTFDYNDEKSMNQLMTFLSKWVIQHIKNEDYKYISYMKD